MAKWFRLAHALLLTTWAPSCQPGQPEVFALWPNGAPGSEARSNEAEIAKDWWVKNIHNPSLTLIRPKPGRGKGAAVVIVPGGGHKQLVFGPEGLAPARFFAKRGITAFVLKHRLANEEGSPYSVEKHARADGLRAVRWVRHNAAKYDLDPSRIGIMGWSAGGELAALVSYGDSRPNAASTDMVERQSALPNFHIAIYPGPIGIPNQLRSDAPPAFLLAANDDAMAAKSLTRLLNLYRQAGASVEMHLLAKGGHAFNMGDRSSLKSVRNWPDRLDEWLQSQELI